MADVKWIKIVVDIFDNRKIKQIESMPDADAIIVIWFKILCLAGTINENGLIIFTKDIPYTDEMISHEFNRPINTVRLALQSFVKFGMIEIIDNIYCVSNWEKYQSVESMERIREQTRLRNIEYRNRKKIETSCVTSRDATEQELELELERDLEQEIDINYLPGAKKSTVQKQPSVIDIPLCDKTLYPVFQTDVSKWSDLYPAVDIMQELRKIVGWCDANPKLRKTKTGVMRFINSWLSRSQDSSHRNNIQPAKIEQPKITGNSQPGYSPLPDWLKEGLPDGS